MNYGQADSVKELAAPVDKVLKKLEWDCPECKGKGKIKVGSSYPMEGMIPSYRGCITCGGHGKLSYSHVPQVGEWYLLCDKQAANSELFLISDEDDIVYISSLAPQSEVVLIPEWEIIEEILEKAGYKLEMLGRWMLQNRKEYVITIKYRNDSIVETISNSRLIAVYDAVNKLGKELK